jgi:hypothetical protein
MRRMPAYRRIGGNGPKRQPSDSGGKNCSPARGLADAGVPDAGPDSVAAGVNKGVADMIVVQCNKIGLRM